MARFSETILAVLGLADISPEVPIPGERRREYRRPVDLTAVSEIMEPYKRLDCRVVDLSNSGAQLKFTKPDEVPDNFRLYILQQNIILECKVAWRRENNIGVSFSPIPNDFH